MLSDNLRHADDTSFVYLLVLVGGAQDVVFSRRSQVHSILQSEEAEREGQSLQVCIVATYILISCNF